MPVLGGGFKGGLSLLSFGIECSCMAPLTPAVMAMRGFTIHPRSCIVLISGSYLVYLCSRACTWNLSWQYVNSTNWNVWVG